LNHQRKKNTGRRGKTEKGSIDRGNKREKREKKTGGNGAKSCKSGVNHITPGKNKNAKGDSFIKEKK